MRLRTRVLLSHTLVVVVGAAAMFVVATFVTRGVYQTRIRGFGLGRGTERGRGQGNAANDSADASVSEGDLVSALDDALLPALLVGAGVALVTAVIVAVVLARRLTRPIEDIGAATRQMAAGDFDARVPLPADDELAALGRDVNALGERLERTEQRRTQLLGEVTHELRTPLTVLGGTFEGILDGVIEPTDEVVAAMAGEATRLERLVDDLTLLSRADEGTLELRPVPCDLAEIARSVVARLETQFEEVDLQCVAPEAVGVHGDPDRLAQVVTNLVGNALAHTPRDGRVTVEVTTRGHDGVVEVADTGTGIAPDDLDRIFDRFYRGDDDAGTDRPARAGRGIGLTIARSLARAHGGDVTATSPGRGAGATFRLTVPVDGPTTSGHPPRG